MADPTDCRYASRIIKHNGVGKTLLHLAAEGFKERKLSTGAIAHKRDFTEIAKSLLERDPDIVYLTTHPGKRQLATELALENFDDEMASILINATTQKSRYAELLALCIFQFQFHLNNKFNLIHFYLFERFK